MAKWQLNFEGIKAASQVGGVSLATGLFVTSFAVKAQTAEGEAPPQFQSLDENNVDLIGGMPNFRHSEISIGSGELGLGRSLNFYARQDSNFGSIDARNDGSGAIAVSIGSSSTTFIQNGSLFTDATASGASLVYSSASDTYTYTSRNGVIATFLGGIPFHLAIIQSITYPNGLVKTFTYSQHTGEIQPGVTAVVFTPKSVTSNAGYSLIYNDTPTGFNVAAVNNSLKYCAPALPCNPDTSTGAISSVSEVTQSQSYTNNGLDGSTTLITLTDTTPEGRAFVTERTIVREDLPDPYVNAYKYDVTVVATESSGAAKTYQFGQFSTPDPYGPVLSRRVKSVTKGSDVWTYTWSTLGTGITGSPVRVNGVTVVAPWGKRRIALNYAGMWNSRVTTDEIWLSGTGSTAQYLTTQYEYDSNARLSKIVKPEGNFIEYEYDGRGNVLIKREGAKPNSGQSPLVYTYGYPATCGNIVTCNKPTYFIDPRGARTDYTYDAVHGGVLTKTGPANDSGIRPQTRFSYQQYSAKALSSSGQLVALSPIWMLSSTSKCFSSASCSGSADELITVYSYDDNLRVIQESTRLGDSSLISNVNNTYDAVGNRTYVDGPLAGSADIKRSIYDADRKLIGTISPDPDGPGPLGNHTRRISYNGDAGPSLIEDGYAADLTDLAFGNMSVTARSIKEYDSLGRLTADIAKGSDNVATSVTHYSYDAAGRLVCTAVRMDPAQWSSQSDACVPQLNGPNGPDRITKNIYDAAGQLVQVRKAVGTPLEQAYATYAYTPNGKQQVVVDANGNKAEMRYDGFDRLERWVFPALAKPANFDASTPTSALNSTGGLNESDFELYGYDDNGNRTSLQKRDGQTLTYTYDALNRVTKKEVEDRPGLSATHTRDVYYDYDLRGLQTKARFDSLTGEGLTTTYDGFGRVSSNAMAMDSQTRSLSYLYDANGNRTRITLPDASYFTYSFDGLDRPDQILTSTGSVLVDYSFNNAGRLTDDARSGSMPDRSFGYDPIGRLQSLAITNGSSANVAWSYTRNPAGQILSELRDNDAYKWDAHENVNRSYAVNGLNQYTSGGPATYCYDKNGSLTADGTYVYKYDVENRLVERRVKEGTACPTDTTGYAGALLAALRYDPLGRLYEVKGYTSGVLTSTTRFTYDGDALVAEYDGSGTLLRRYVHGSDVGADDPLVWMEGSNLRMVYADPRGSIVLVRDSAGATIATNSYDEYGIPGTANQGRFQYTGQAWIPELQMYHYKARVYSPTLGRFLQTDPIGYDDQVNLYAYVGNDPVNGTDPTGMDCDGEVCDSGAFGQIVVTGSKLVNDITASYQIVNALPGILNDVVDAYTISLPEIENWVDANIWDLKGVPEEAFDVLETLTNQNYKALPGQNFKPRVHENKKGLLPPGGKYIEYRFNPWDRYGMKPEGHQRLVVDVQTGAAWVTLNHYKSFIRIR